MAAEGVFYIEAFVSDFERSKQFYAETLGWKLNTDLPGVAGFFFGSAYLVIMADNRLPEDRCYKGGMHVEVKVDDIEAEYSRLKSLGLELSEISEKPWGERKFTFHDPDGYPWSYGQPS